MDYSVWALSPLELDFTEDMPTQTSLFLGGRTKSTTGKSL